MGYRSDVVIQIEAYKKEALAVAKEILDECEPDELNEVEEKDYSIGVPIYRLVARYDYRKWYQEYDEVKAINNLTFELGRLTENKNPSNNTIKSVQYFRVGEDYEDIETITYGEPNKYLGITRKIEIEL